MDRNATREIAKYGIAVGDRVRLDSGTYSGQLGTVTRVATTGTGRYRFVIAYVRLDSGTLTGAGLDDLTKS